VSHERVHRLRIRRRRLLAGYLGFLCLFTSTGALAATDVAPSLLMPAMLMALLATLPVIVLNISLHRAIRAVRPSARSVGGRQALLSAVVFTPFEAALILPAINLWVAHAVLRECREHTLPGDDAALGRTRPRRGVGCGE